MTKQKMVFITLVVILLFHCFIVEPNSLETTRYEIKEPKLAGARIAFLSDFHLKKGDYARLNKVVKETRKYNPNIVLLGGDFARGQNYNATMDIGLVASKLSLIGAPMYAVLGESDWWNDGKKIMEGLKQNGVTVLENSNKRIILKRQYVDIIGIADITTRQPNIDLAFHRTQVPRIVITHNPDIYYDILDEVTLILAGHTHGGQIIIPYTPALFVPSKFGSEFASGLIKSAHNRMIISKGIGTTGIPMRFNCKPEIVIVDFVN